MAVSQSGSDETSVTAAENTVEAGMTEVAKDQTCTIKDDVTVSKIYVSEDDGRDD